MTASSQLTRNAALCACTTLLLLTPCRLAATSIAVLRGQTTIDASTLPLVCLEVGTVGTPLLIDNIVFENMDTERDTTKTIANTFDRAHAEALTAAAPGPTSLTLPILKFPPGRYRIKSITFVGPGNGYSLDLSTSKIWFEVKPGVVNYVGGIELSADWRSLFGRSNPKLEHNEHVNVSTQTSVVFKDTIPRDIKWACSQIPGMIPLPAIVSHLRN